LCASQHDRDVQHRSGVLPSLSGQVSNVLDLLFAASPEIPIQVRPFARVANRLLAVSC
jgi:hypothetical protein